MSDALTAHIRNSARSVLEKELQEMARIVALAAALYPERKRFEAKGYTIRLSLAEHVPGIYLFRSGLNGRLWWCYNAYRYRVDRRSRRGNLTTDFDRDLSGDPQLAVANLLSDLDAGRLYVGCGWHSKQLLDLNDLSARSLARFGSNQRALSDLRAKSGGVGSLDRVAGGHRSWWQRMFGE